MIPPIDKTDISDVVTSAEVERWSKGKDSAVDSAIARGWGEIRSAALNRFTPESFDAITSDDLPELVRGYAVALSADWLSSGNSPDESVGSNAARARSWLALLASGKDHTLDALCVGVKGAAGRVTSVRRKRVFSKQGRHSEFRRHDEPLD